MFFFIDMNDRTKCIQQTVEWMLLVIPNFIQQLIELFDGCFVLTFITNGEQRGNMVPVGLKFFCDEGHFLVS
jgi:hypothetical protein